MADVTRILAAVAGGDGSAAEQLLAVVYEDLRRMATAQVRREPKDLTLQATALVHEAYLRLFGGGPDHPAPSPAFKNRAHFFAAAGEAMRRILVEEARRRRQKSKGGDRMRVPLDGPLAAEPSTSEASVMADVLAVHEALTKLEEFDRRMAEIVKLRCFVGMDIADVAKALALSSRTVNRDWLLAKAWLRRELGPTEEARGLG